MKKEQPLWGKILGWMALMLIIAAWVYAFTHGSSGCTVNPYYGDDGCYDQYQD